MTPRTALALTLAAGTLASCAEAQGVDPAPHPEVTGAGAAVRLVDPTEADLVLWVSNQSFDDAEVRLTVTVDTVTVVDGDFHVEGQHNWIRFPLALRPGRHDIEAGSDSGARLAESFQVPRRGTRYAVIDHWTEDGSADLTWHFSRQPVAFA
jgi:hypothetical protein